MPIRNIRDIAQFRRQRNAIREIVETAKVCIMSWWRTQNIEFINNITLALKNFENWSGKVLRPDNE